MIRVHCRTNLDLHPCEDWPTELPAMPQVGQWVESITKRSCGRLRLKIDSLCWVGCELELWLIAGTSVAEFHEYYKAIQGK